MLGVRFGDSFDLTVRARLEVVIFLLRLNQKFECGKIFINQ